MESRRWRDGSSGCVGMRVKRGGGGGGGDGGRRFLVRSRERKLEVEFLGGKLFGAFVVSSAAPCNS